LFLANYSTLKKETIIVRWIPATLAFTQLAFVQAWTVGQEVNTTSGFYTGHASKSRPLVSEYLGIRFGEETSGDRRFAKPIKHISNDKFAANKFGDDCPGMLTNATGLLMAGMTMLLQGNGKASEDCLFINLWTKPQAGDKKKAVLLWMYGGGFNIGSANSMPL
jgi:cholinesterase